ncbi:F-box protein At4g35930 isoform X1 [Cryptomeria japonica]|uniref:F-box protein At4g35930 isoform X1 n=3 Tax=Cryptomeria japonica TaxID=3369 RepID=UPI0027DA15CE|nr:F-box protein At4g35930 isoform X1 [Cryptomeria japonica]
MYYKELRETLKQAKDLKMQICCEAKKKNCRRRRRVGKRASRTNAACSMGRKRIAVNSFASHEKSAEFFSGGGRNLFTRVGNSSPVIGEKMNLASETDIESLPLDILVQIICNFHHDEVKTLCLVSRKFREAVVIARQMHFDFSTPVRVRATKRRLNSLMPHESSKDCASSFGGFESLCDSCSTPATPNAPKQVSKFQKTRLAFEEMKEMPSLLFYPGTPAKYDDEKLLNQNHFLRSRGCITNRVLFVEDELCDAVARNRI